MSQQEHLQPPKRTQETQSEGSLRPTKAKVVPLDGLNVDQFLSEDAEKFLKDNRQKGGE